ncbi:MAG: tetratricopeptide repeat protein [Rhodospirillaceae bacterium]
MLNQAVAFHQAGNLTEAKRLYEQVLRTDPRNFPAQYQLALLLYQQQTDALPAVEAALKLNPQSREALLLHCVLLMGRGDLAPALTSISKITAANPRDLQAWHNRGVILTRLARFQDAVVSFEQALAVTPNAESWDGHGSALHLQKRLEEALRSFDNALALAPRFAAALCHRGSVLADLKRYGEAVQAFEAALTQSPDMFEAWSNRGSALYEMERMTEALESYDRALALRPRHAPDWINRGKALEVLERVDDAIASYDTALSIAPDNAEAWYARSLTLRTMHRFEEALTNVDKALAIDPTARRALVQRAWLLCELNRVTEGLAIMCRAADQAIASGLIAGMPTSPHKQRHDAEQRDYLAAQGIAVAEGGYHFAEGGKLSGPAINQANIETASAQWARREPRIAVIDNLLTDEALVRLRRFCWDSTIWHKSYKDGYLGAMPEQGFACPLLAQIAEELRDTFPAIIGDHRLRMMWGFKYDSQLKGIGIHADQAAVNVNFWITPDEANLNPEGGGLVVWDAAAPDDWDPAKYNGDEPGIRDFLAKAGAKPVKVPYRSNRAVIFDSDLFHETDTIEFNEGYLNRRINLTMLYGRRTYYGR